MRIFRWIVIGCISFNMSAVLASFDNQQDLDLIVAEEAARVYRVINNSEKWAYPEGNTTQNYKSNSLHWFAKDLYWVDLVEYQKVKEVSLCKALDSLLELGGHIDCRLVQKFVFLQCVRSVLGDKLFDRTCKEFEDQEDKKFWLAGGEPTNPFMKLIKPFIHFI